MLTLSPIIALWSPYYNFISQMIDLRLRVVNNLGKEGHTSKPRGWIWFWHHYQSLVIWERITKWKYLRGQFCKRQFLQDQIHTKIIIQNSNILSDKWMVAVINAVHLWSCIIIWPPFPHLLIFVGYIIICCLD